MLRELKFYDVIVQQRKFLIFIFILSVVVRIAVFIGYLSKHENYWQVDSQTYHLVAQQIAQGKGITSADGTPHFYRLPGYPLWLGFFYSVFGVDKKNVLWPQLIVASAIPVLVFFLSMVLFPGMIMVARSAALWTCIHLGFVLYAGFFMTETLFVFLLLLFFIFFFSSYQLFFCHSGQMFERKKRLFLAGLFLGLASLFRPVGHYLIVLSCVLLLFSQGSYWCRFKKILIITGAWFGIVSFWLLRNLILTGYLFFHTLPGGHFLYLSAARVAMHVQHCSYQEARQYLQDEVQQMIIQKEKEVGRPLMEIENCKVHEQLAVKYFTHHPLIALKNWSIDIMRAALSLYSAELLFLESGRQVVDYFKKERSCWDMFKRYLFPKTDSLLLKIIIAFEILLFMFLLLGFIGYLVTSLTGLLRLQGELLCVLSKCLPFIMLFVVIALAGGYARMRLPIESLMIILSLHWTITVYAKKYAHRF